MKKITRIVRVLTTLLALLPQLAFAQVVSLDFSGITFGVDDFGTVGTIVRLIQLSNAIGVVLAGIAVVLIVYVFVQRAKQAVEVSAQAHVRRLLRIGVIVFISAILWCFVSRWFIFSTYVRQMPDVGLFLTPSPGEKSIRALL